ncbi:MAG: NAD(P)H-hydrate epimerase [Planctomycetota bacterium]|jgi:NAD(P)H-hydrate epimerase
MASPQYILDRASVRSVDRAAIEEYGIPGIVLMENAARGLAAAALRMLDDAPGNPPSVLIVCGSGNNGGDGYALGRHLHNAGVAVALAALGEPKAGSDAATNLAICRKMRLPEIPVQEIPRFQCDLIVDAIFGTGLDRPVTGTPARVMDWINASGRPVLAVDVPSGLDCDTGRPLGVTVRAARTVTFVARKPGLALPAARELVGEVVVADIGAPVELVRRFGRPVPPAAPDDPPIGDNSPGPRR